MTEIENNKIDKIEKLVEVVASNVLKLTEDMSTIKIDVSEVKNDIRDMKTDIVGLKNQVEGTNKRIDNLAMNRVKYEDHNQLKARVVVLEEKFA